MDGKDYVICSKCGEQLPMDALFCSKCGNNLKDTTQKPQKVKGAKRWGMNCAVLVIALFVINFVLASGLKKELMRDWSRVEGESGAYIDCILDFSESEIEYRLETGYKWMDTTIAEYDYIVLTNNWIMVKRYGDWDPIHIEFNEEKEMMICTPALTSTDKKEYWFNRGY